MVVNGAECNEIKTEWLSGMTPRVTRTYVQRSRCGD